MRSLIIASLFAIVACAAGDAQEFPTADAAGASHTIATVIDRCGDGKIQTSEKCDDGNTTSGDGCSSNCVQEIGYVCTGSPSACVPTARIIPPASALLFYRADDLFSSTISSQDFNTVGLGVIGSWPNRGARTSADLTQGSGAAKPILEAGCVNGHACANFLGQGSQNLSMTSGSFTSIAQPFTACGVVEPQALSGYQAYVGATDTNFYMYATTTSGNRYGASSSGFFGIEKPTIDLGAFDVVCYYANGASSRLTVNGTNVATGSPGANALTAFTFGSAPAGQPWGGRVAEWGVWSGDVSSLYAFYAKAYYGALGNITTVAHAATPSVCAIGDSITFGAGGGIAYTRYLQSYVGNGWNVTNYGVSSTHTSEHLTTWTNTVRGAGCTHLLLLSGANDVRQDLSTSSAIANITTICQQARADGIVVEISTILPWKNSTFADWTSGRQTNTDTVNTAIRALPSSCAGVIVVDGYALFGDPSDARVLNLNVQFDGLHMTNPGYQLLAAAFIHP